MVPLGLPASGAKKLIEREKVTVSVKRRAGDCSRELLTHPDFAKHDDLQPG